MSTEEPKVRTGTKTVAVVILNWNGGKDIIECVRSVFASSYRNLQIVLVDNGSSDGSTYSLCRLYPDIHVIANAENLGFAKGCNQGIAWASEQQIPYILLLNADASVEPDLVEKLMHESKSGRNAVVACPRMMGPLSKSTADQLWFAYGTVRLWAGYFGNPAALSNDASDWSVARDMEYASGCCMLIPRDVLAAVGMFDERFFAYCEDIDLSLRIRKAGFPLRYVPSAVLRHGSCDQPPREHTEKYRYLTTRNSFWVVRKHGSIVDFILCLCIQPLRSLYRIVRGALRGNLAIAAAEFRGLRDGIFSDLKHKRTNTYRSELSDNGVPGA